VTKTASNHVSSRPIFRDGREDRGREWQIDDTLACWTLFMGRRSWMARKP